MTADAIKASPVEREDVAAALSAATEALTQLAELFRVVSSKAGDGSSIARLADAGAYIGADVGNFVDCIRGRLEDGGIQQ